MTNAVGAASQWWENERMVVYFKLMMVKCILMMAKCSLMMVKCSSMMVKWVYDQTLILPSLTSISPSLPWSKPSFAHLTIIEKLYRLQCPWLIRGCRFFCWQEIHQGGFGIFFLRVRFYCNRMSQSWGMGREGG